VADWSDEETDNPLYADDRNFCKVENRVPSSRRLDSWDALFPASPHRSSRAVESGGGHFQIKDSTALKSSNPRKAAQATLSIRPQATAVIGKRFRNTWTLGAAPQCPVVQIYRCSNEPKLNAYPALPAGLACAFIQPTGIAPAPWLSPPSATPRRGWSKLATGGTSYPVT